MRIGHGYDAHRLAPGIPLVLGGVAIQHDYGLLGHSDADVLAHAIIDSLLGAAALGDIGTYFPSSNPHYSGISSMELLARVRDILAQSGWKAANVDATIVAERPRLSPYVGHMCEAIAHSLGLELGQVNVKAKTTDGLGFVGAGEGIEAHAVAIVEPATPKDAASGRQPHPYGHQLDR
ncbi:MAG: 2-C-methyl-D-erythritol 2,4-cyclodiphosphate synthase [Chloroflexi bacterium]|nr:2-C-methyl-D-erythritol 2,4-cyclodiphosphate synthase [Chloroflexota bacterium]